MSSDSKSESTAQPKRIEFNNELADTLIAEMPVIFEDPDVAKKWVDTLFSIDKPADKELQEKIANAYMHFQKILDDTSETFPGSIFLGTILKACMTTNTGKLNSLLRNIFNDHFTRYPPHYIKNFLLLLKNLGADVNSQDNDGWTALHYAALSNNVEAIRFLAPLVSDINFQNAEGLTPLSVAVQAGHIDSIKILIEHQASIHVTDSEKRTLLHLASKWDQTEVIPFLADSDINAKDNMGNTPLHNAVFRGNNNTVRVLLEYKADINVKNKQGESPLKLAINSNTLKATEITRILLANGAEASDLYSELSQEESTSDQKPDKLKILTDYVKAPRTDAMKEIDGFTITAVNEQNTLNAAELPNLLTTPGLTPKDLTAIVADYLQPLDSKAVQLNNESVQPIKWIRETLIALTDIISYKIYSEKEIELQAAKAIMELASEVHRKQYDAYWIRLQTARKKNKDLYQVPTSSDMYKILPVIVNTTPAQNESKKYKIETKQMSPTRARAGSFLISSHQLSSQPRQETPQKQTPDQADQEALSDPTNSTPRGPGFSSSEG